MTHYNKNKNSLKYHPCSMAKQKKSIFF